MPQTKRAAPPLLGLTLAALLGGCAQPGLESGPAGHLRIQSNTTYYVDAACSGCDVNAGTSSGAPWQTLGKVNATTFGPGDRILFKAGGVWSGQLRPKGSGSNAAAITIDQYGSGAKPRINGGGSVSDAVYLESQAYWDINNLEVTNDAPAAAARTGIRVRNASGGALNHIHIQNVNVHNIKSNASGYYGTNAGIAVVADLTSSSWNDVLISGNTVTTVERVGIFVGPTAQSPAPSNDNYLGFTHSTNVVVQNNVLTDLGNDGILAYVTNGAQLKGNTVSGFTKRETSACPETYCNKPGAGIWVAASPNAVIQDNEVSGGVACCRDGIDGQAFDIDWGSDNVKVQYNYSHDNAGGFILLVLDSAVGAGSHQNDGAVVRYNVSRNDSCCLINFSSDAFAVTNKLKIYNNTFYVPSGRTLAFIDSYGNGYINNAFDVNNNVIYNLGSMGFRAGDGVYDGNVFYGNHNDQEPADVHKLVSDPILVNPGSGGTGRASLDGYKLQASSPALNSGVLIADSGGRDFFGNSISSSAAPNRGAYGGVGVASANLVQTATFTPSSSIESYGWSTAAMHDGQRNATSPVYGWSSDSNLNANHTETVVISLTSRQWFNRVDLYPRNDAGNVGYGFPTDFTIDVWNGSQWLPMVTKTGYAQPGNAVQSFGFPVQWTDQIRIQGTGLRANPNDGNAYRMQFAEVEVYNQ